MKKKVLMVLVCVAFAAVAAVGCAQTATPSESPAASASADGSAVPSPENVPQDTKVYADRLMTYETELGNNVPDEVKVGKEEFIGQRPYTMATTVEKGEDGQETVTGHFAFDLETGDVYQYNTETKELTQLFNVTTD